MTEPKEYKVTCAYCKFVFYVKYLEYNLICNGCNKIIGYHEDNKGVLLKHGSLIVVPRDTEYHSMLSGDMVAKRSTTKKVHHCLNGSMDWKTDFLDEGRRFVEIYNNPTVRWVGSGKYWCSADINDVIVKYRRE